MADNQYSKRFNSKLKQSLLICVPVVLVLTLFFNNFIITAYYKINYKRPYIAKARQIETLIAQQHALPDLPDVTYRKLPPGTTPYTYMEETYIMKGTRPGLTHYITTLPLNNDLYEANILHIHTDSNNPPDTKLVVICAFISLLFFFLLNWIFVKAQVRRATFNLWAPFYQNLRRINTYNVYDNAPLKLVPTGTKEFEYFNTVILDFSEKIRTAWDQVREFSENTAHELQTPLSIVLAKSEIILKHDKLDERDKKELLEIRRTVLRLSNTQKALNLLSRIKCCDHTSIGIPDKIEVNVNKILEESVEFYEELIQYKELSVHIQQKANLTLHSNPELIRILVDNLLRNAIQHNHQKGYILINVSDKGFQMCNTGLSTNNTENPEDLFVRYKTMSKDKGRLGLGLAIVRAISEKLGLECAYQFNQHMHSFSIRLY